VTEHDALLLRVIETRETNPDDIAPALVYADWLEENGEEDRAQWVRACCGVDPNRVWRWTNLAKIYPCELVLVHFDCENQAVAVTLSSNPHGLEVKFHHGIPVSYSILWAGYSRNSRGIVRSVNFMSLPSQYDEADRVLRQEKDRLQPSIDLIEKHMGVHLLQ